jgi:hypothetical protein
MLFGAFRPPKPAPGGPGTAQTWGWKMITVHEKMYP